jgi:glycerol kinase
MRESVLARLVSTSEVYGNATYDPLKGVPLAGLGGNRQGALIGDKCLTRGKAKCTYGTSAVLPFCTGTDIVSSNHGLLSMVRDCGSGSVGVDTASQVAYQVGSKEKPVYALEGASESTTFSFLLYVGARSPHSCRHKGCYQMAVGHYEDD